MLYFTHPMGASAQRVRLHHWMLINTAFFNMHSVKVGQFVV